MAARAEPSPRAGREDVAGRPALRKDFPNFCKDSLGNANFFQGFLWCFVGFQRVTREKVRGAKPRARTCTKFDAATARFSLLNRLRELQGAPERWHEKFARGFCPSCGKRKICNSQAGRSKAAPSPSWPGLCRPSTSTSRELAPGRSAIGPGGTGAANLRSADLAPTWMTGTSPVMTALQLKRLPPWELRKRFPFHPRLGDCHDPAARRRR
jgi:hypothetical protein